MNIILLIFAGLIVAIWIKHSHGRAPIYNDLIDEDIDGFDVDILFKDAIKAINKFANEHKDETFYGFAIDSDLLCFNSIEKFEKSLAESKLRWPEAYSTASEIYDLKWNTGDWDYMAFADLKSSAGFDHELYNEHYDTVMYLVDQAMDQPGFEGFGPLDKPAGADDTPYGRAMNQLLDRLIKADAFSVIKTTNNFLVTRVEHSY
jgi:hypothetical protein